MQTNTDTTTSNDATTATKKEKLPANLQRASTMRRKAGQFDRDIKQLTKWEKNDNDEKVVETLIGRIKALASEMNDIADLYEALPEDVMVTRRGSTKFTPKPGMVLQAKEKYREEYNGLVASPTQLRVIQVRAPSVLVEDTAGVKVLAKIKELEPREDA